MVCKISRRARVGVKGITDYLEAEFGEQFAVDYYIDFKAAISMLQTLPLGFPIASEQNRLRKLVFRKRTTMYYRVLDFIEIVAIIDSRQDFKV